MHEIKWKICKILCVIKKVLNGWKPTDIFHDGHRRYNGIGDWTGVASYRYTVLGRWFNSAPDIVSLFKLFWYIPAWFIYIIANIVWFIIEVFLPESVKAGL